MYHSKHTAILAVSLFILIFIFLVLAVLALLLLLLLVFFFPFCCFSFSSYSCYSFFVVVVFVVAVLLLLLFSSSVQHPAIPLASHQVALGPAAPGPKDWKLAPWVEISQSLEVEDPWNSQQKHLKIGPKIVPKGTEASSNDGCSVFFFAVSFAKGKNDGWICVCRISFHQWWCPTW